MTPSGVELNAEQTCTEVALRLGGGHALIERRPLPASTAGHRGSTSGRIEGKYRGSKIFSFFCRYFCCKLEGFSEPGV
jgi:hypothetical protein